MVREIVCSHYWGNVSRVPSQIFRATPKFNFFFFFVSSVDKRPLGSIARTMLLEAYGRRTTLHKSVCVCFLFQIVNKFLDKDAQTVRLEDLTPETRYLVCVLGLGNGMVPNGSRHLLTGGDTQSSRCAEVKTLEGEVAYYPDERLGGSLLTRRLGLIIGCCLGCVVFVVLVTVLGYLKIKKQREDTKREQPLPPEYLSYRHFSLHATDPMIIAAPAPCQSTSQITTIH